VVETKKKSTRIAACTTRRKSYTPLNLFRNPLPYSFRNKQQADANSLIDFFRFSAELRGRVARVRKVGGVQQGGHVSMAVGGKAVQVSRWRAAVLANADAGRRALHHRQDEAVQGTYLVRFRYASATTTI